MKFLCRVFLTLFVVGGVLIAVEWRGDPLQTQMIRVTIPLGSAREGVAKELARTGLVTDPRWYWLYSMFDPSARYPVAGTYTLRKGSSYRALARALSHGPERQEVEITIIEGRTIDQTRRDLFDQYRIEDDRSSRAFGRSVDRQPFDPAWRDTVPFLKDLPRSRSLEGYLFPDTYRVWQDELPEGLIRKQLQAFADRYGSLYGKMSTSHGLTLDHVVILASIVEREVTADDDRKHVAGIFLNRLQIGMPLQSDATLAYLTASTRARASASDLVLDSPYNSYTHPGLPPGPICSPSASAMRAVLAPTQTPDLYFLTDPDGRVWYAQTYEEHLKNQRLVGY